MLILLAHDTIICLEHFDISALLSPGRAIRDRVAEVGLEDGELRIVEVAHRSQQGNERRESLLDNPALLLRHGAVFDAPARKAASVVLHRW